MAPDPGAADAGGEHLPSYRRYIRLHVVPHIGGILLQQLTPLDLTALYRALLESGRRPATPPKRVHPAGVESGPPVTDMRLHFVRRNYSADSLETLAEEAPFPCEDEEKWSQLPPLIWTLSIPVVWGACKFTGTFFETLGKESAESFATWLRAAWSRSKEPDRDRMLVLRFELGNGTSVYGFVPSECDAVGAEEILLAGLKQANTLAGFAGLQKQRGVLPGMERAAFIFKDGRWNLAWWTDGAAVYRTHWFDRNMPDPAGYLGRPLLGD